MTTWCMCWPIFTYEQEKHGENAAKMEVLENWVGKLEGMQSNQHIKISKQEKLCVHC